MQSSLTRLGSPRAGVRALLGLGVLALAVGYLAATVEWSAAAGAVSAAGSALGAAPLALGGALVAYAAAFGLRTWGWRRVLPGLGAGQAWAALHVSLLGNHVLPLRLGELLRVTSVLRRTTLPARPVVASVIALRLTDLLAVVALATLTGGASAVGTATAVALLGTLLVAVGVGWWLLRRRPDPAVVLATVGAWLLESVVILAVADTAGLGLSYGEAVGVTAVTIVAQAVAVTPGGIGTYEAAGTAALVALGAPGAEALAVVLLAHAVKAGYALLVGSAALFVPVPGYWGRWRLPRQLPARPTPATYGPDAPVVAFLPAHDEQDTVGAVVRRLPTRVAGRTVEVVVVDDDSTDSTAERAERAGAQVVRVRPNRSLGAAVRRRLAEAVARQPACVVYLDADGEYAPEDLAAVAAPVLDGSADYVVGSRFAGQIERMRPHRRIGNKVLTAWVRWMTRRRDVTDGQSGYCAFSPAAAAAAEVVHDYNYAQVLTLDLLGKGYAYAEVPIRYRFRSTGRSFVRLGRYLRRVLPAVHAQLNP